MRGHVGRWALIVAIVVIGCVPVAASAFAGPGTTRPQSLGQPAAAARASGRAGVGALVRLPNEVAPAVRDAIARGLLTPERAGGTVARAPITVTVTLRRTRQAAFERFLAAVENPRSPEFRHFLSPRALAARFGPSERAYDAVLRWARGRGFTLETGSADRLTLTVKGTRGTAERAFQVTLGRFGAAGSQRLYAPLANPSVPAALAGDIESVDGLSDVGEPSTPRPENVSVGCPGGGGGTSSMLRLGGRLRAFDSAGAGAGGGASCSLYPKTVDCLGYINQGLNPPAPIIAPFANDIRFIRYVICALTYVSEGGKFQPLSSFQHIRAAGALMGRSLAAHATTGAPKVGLLEYDTFEPSDVDDLLQLAGLGSLEGDFSEVPVDGGVGSPGAGESEVLLDLDSVLALTDGAAKVVVYDAPSSTSFETMFNTMIGDGDTVISNSWSSCEDDVSAAEADGIDSVLAEAAADGISVFNGSGDSGSTCLDGSADTVGVPADSPNATSVGGSTLQTGTGLSYGSQSYWNGTAATPVTGAGGFGVSRYFSRPSYQDGLTTASGRSVPDVVAPADPAANGIPLCQADLGGCPDGRLWGGTSLAAPEWAAQAAILDTLLGGPLGNLDDRLYPLAGTDAFHDAAALGSDFAHVGLGDENWLPLERALAGGTIGSVNATTSDVVAIGAASVLDSGGTTVPADGTTTGTVEVDLSDGTGYPVSGKAVTLAATGCNGAVISAPSGVSDTTLGSVEFTVTDATPETCTFVAKDATDDVTLSSEPTLTFVSPVAAGGEISAEQTDPSDATITVFLQNGLGRPAVGKEVSLDEPSGSGTISPTGGDQTTDANGDATFTVNDPNTESDTFTATDVTDGNLPVPGAATVNFNSGSTGCDPGPPSTTAGYTISDFATGVPFNANAFELDNVYFGPCDGAGTPAFDASGNAYVPDGFDGEIYKLGPNGGTASVSDALPDASFSGDDLSGLAIDKNGDMFASLGAPGGNFDNPEVVQLDPSTGAIERVVADESTGLGQCPAALAADPQSGDLFITDFCTFGRTGELEEIVDPESASPTVVPDYATFPSTGGIGSDGIAVDASGTMYVALPGSSNPVVSVTGPESADPGTVTVLDDSTSDPDENIVGVAIAATNANGDATALYATTGDYGFTQGQDGDVLRLDDIAAPPVTGTLIAGPRSGIGLGAPATSPDGCTFIPDADVEYELSTATGCGATANPAPTITLTDSASGPAPIGSTVTYTATLSHFASDADVPVTFEVDGANGQVKLVDTGAGGVATFTEQGVLSGADQVSASAPASSTQAVSSATLVQRWLTGTGALDVTDLDLNATPQAGAAGSPTTIVASLDDLSETPVTTLSGQTVTLGIGGQTCTARTDSAGVASCAVTPASAGLQTLTAHFAGATGYTPATSSTSFSVTAGSGTGTGTTTTTTTASPRPPVVTSTTTSTTLTTSTSGAGTTTVTSTTSTTSTTTSHPTTTTTTTATPRPRPGCPVATGSLSGTRLGQATLRMTRRQLARAYPRSATRGTRYQEFLCLTPIGIRVGFASPALLARAAPPLRAALSGRVVWISSSNPRYAVDGVRSGMRLAGANRRLRLRLSERVGVGVNDWYFAAAGGVTVVLKVRHGVVEEVGIAVGALTRNAREDRSFISSFI